jgi:hypothetical protein
MDKCHTLWVSTNSGQNGCKCTMTTRQEVAAAVMAAREYWERRPTVIAYVARNLLVSYAELARRMDMTPQALNSRLRGRTPLHAWELDGFATALDVPVEVLEMEVSEALHWLADNRAVDIRNGCFPGMHHSAA